MHPSSIHGTGQINTLDVSNLLTGFRRDCYIVFDEGTNEEKVINEFPCFEERSRTFDVAKGCCTVFNPP